MTAQFGTATGWLIVVLAAVNISLPYLLRGRLLASSGWTMPYLERLRPHYWIGFTIAGLVLLHAGVAMSAPLRPGGLYTAGLWIATGALLVVIGQVTVGMKMRTSRGPERLRLRKLHFRFMLMLVVAGLLHIVLNGPL